MVMGDPDMRTHGLSIITSETSIKWLSCRYEFSILGEEVGHCKSLHRGRKPPLTTFIAI